MIVQRATHVQGAENRAMSRPANRARCSGLRRRGGGMSMPWPVQRHGLFNAMVCPTHGKLRRRRRHHAGRRPRWRPESVPAGAGEKGHAFKRSGLAATRARARANKKASGPSTHWRFMQPVPNSLFVPNEPCDVAHIINSDARHRPINKAERIYDAWTTRAWCPCLFRTRR
jgi:hypothetical protein